MRNDLGIDTSGAARDCRGDLDRLRVVAAWQGCRYGRCVRQRVIGQPVRRRRLGQLSVADDSGPRDGVFSVESRLDLSWRESWRAQGPDATGRDAKSTRSAGEVDGNSPTGANACNSARGAGQCTRLEIGRRSQVTDADVVKLVDTLS